MGSLQIGWAIFGNNQTSLIFVAKYGWDKEETKLYNSLISSVGVIGLMFGSLAGGFLIGWGRRVGIYIAAAITVIGVGLTLVETVPTLVIGRFMNGFAASVFQLCDIKSVVEGVPSKLLGVYGVSSSFFLTFGGFLVITIGAASLPSESSEYMDDQMWRLSYGFPFVLVVFQLILIWTVFRWEPLDYLIA